MYLWFVNQSETKSVPKMYKHVPKCHIDKTFQSTVIIDLISSHVQLLIAIYTLTEQWAPCNISWINRPSVLKADITFQPN